MSMEQLSRSWLRPSAPAGATAHLRSPRRRHRRWVAGRSPPARALRWHGPGRGIEAPLPAAGPLPGPPPPSPSPAAAPPGRACAAPPRAPAARPGRARWEEAAAAAAPDRAAPRAPAGTEVSGARGPLGRAGAPRCREARPGSAGVSPPSCGGPSLPSRGVGGGSAPGEKTDSPSAGPRARPAPGTAGEPLPQLRSHGTVSGAVPGAVPAFSGGASAAPASSCGDSGVGALPPGQDAFRTAGSGRAGGQRERCYPGCSRAASALRGTPWPAASVEGNYGVRICRGPLGGPGGMAPTGHRSLAPGPGGEHSGAAGAPAVGALCLRHLGARTENSRGRAPRTSPVRPGRLAGTRCRTALLWDALRREVQSR